MNAWLASLYLVLYKLSVLFEQAGWPQMPVAGAPDDNPKAEAVAAAPALPRYSAVLTTDYQTMLRRYRWITGNVSEQYPAGHDSDLLSAFKLVITASEDPALGFGPVSAAERRCLNWCFDRIAIDSGQLLDRVGMRYYADTASDGEFGEALVEGGLFQLFQHWTAEATAAAGAPLDVRLNMPVKSVVTTLNATTKASEVHVTCANGEVFCADAVICTTPVGVLKTGAINFSPRPPQLEALCALDMGLMNLIWVWYPKKFWPEGYNFLGVARPDAQDVTLSTLLLPPMKDQHGQEQAIVMCQTVGQFARDIETMSDADVAARVTSLLREIFGDRAVPDAIGCAHSGWSSEQYSMGSYSCTGVGAACSSPPPGAAAADRGTGAVRFAGEATHRLHQGTAHGAYITGIREATQILEDFGVRHRWEDTCFLDHETVIDFTHEPRPAVAV